MFAKQQAQSVWGASPAGQIFAKGLQPGTRDFFESTRRLRNEYEMRSVLELIPFTALADARVLELGCGAGYDALEFCSAGARYTGIDITFENIGRTRRHLALYGYTGHVLHGDAQSLS